MVVNITKVMAPLCDSPSEPLTKPGIILSSKFAILFTNVSNIELVTEMISIAAESFREDVSGCCLSYQDRNSEEPGDSLGDPFPKFVCFADVFSLFFSLIRDGDHTFSFTGDDIEKFSGNVVQVSQEAQDMS